VDYLAFFMTTRSSNPVGKGTRRRLFFDVYLSPGNWILAGVVGCIVLGSVGLFIEFVNPSLKGLNSLRIGADSDFYLWLAGLRQDLPDGYLGGNDVNLVAFGSNLLGPELIAWSLRSNVLILVFNYLVLLFSIRMFAEAENIRPIVLAFLLLANPSVLVSVLTLNKEILALLSVALLGKYLASDRRSKGLLLLLLLVSFLARWEHCAVVLFFLAITAKANPLRYWRKLQIVIMVAVISVAYPFVPHLAQTFGSESFQGTTVGQLTEVQSHFLYFVVAFPKICLNLFGGIAGLAHLGQTSSDPNDVYSTVIVPWSSIMNLVVASWFVLRRRVRLSNDLVFFAAIYLLLFAVTPFVQYRYFLPQYYVMCLEIARRVAPRKYRVLQDSLA
jgi:hypothetical protein